MVQTAFANQIEPDIASIWLIAQQTAAFIGPEHSYSDSVTVTRLRTLKRMQNKMSGW